MVNRMEPGIKKLRHLGAHDGVQGFSHQYWMFEFIGFLKNLIGIRFPFGHALRCEPFMWLH